MADEKARKSKSKMHTYAITFDTGEVYEERAVSVVKALLNHCKEYDVDYEWLIENSHISQIA